MSENKPGHKNPTTTRKCMTCGAKFESEGAHNRMCNECRRKERPSPFDPTG